MAYRPPGRSNRSGRANADNDVFEGLPVKQWSQVMAPVSLAPPKTEAEVRDNDRWGEPPMPRDSQMLHPWTQLLLKLARAGKVGTKRKQDSDSAEEDKPDDDAAAATEEPKQHSVEDRGYVAKRWKTVPEAMLEPEHKHMEFLAKRRKGLGTLYGPDAQIAPVVSMRKTHVQRTGADGEVAVYEVLVPEGQTVEGEVSEPGALAEVKPVTAAPGTVVEGVGVANDDGVLVAEHLKPNAAPRRNRPPPKKKGGPGRGKKRVTFTNPDGSTYTTIVPNATKIVPQPGQTVKHVAKGEEATADISAEQAAANSGGVEGDEGDDDDDGDEDGDDDGDEDDDREEGEVSETETTTAAGTPAAKSRSASAAPQSIAKEETSLPPTDLAVLPDVPPADIPAATVVEIPTTAVVEEKVEERASLDATDVPLALGPQEPEVLVAEAAVPEPDPVEVSVMNDTAMDDAVELPEVPVMTETPAIATEELPDDSMNVDTEVTEPEAVKLDDGEEDLLGNLEKTLVQEATAVEPPTEEEPTDHGEPQVDKPDEQEALPIEQTEEPEAEPVAETEKQAPADEVAEVEPVAEAQPAETATEEPQDDGEAKAEENVELSTTEES